jgi:hypothetical protein
MTTTTHRILRFGWNDFSCRSPERLRDTTRRFAKQYTANLCTPQRAYVARERHSYVLTGFQLLCDVTPECLEPGD